MSKCNHSSFVTPYEFKFKFTPKGKTDKVYQKGLAYRIFDSQHLLSFPAYTATTLSSLFWIMSVAIGYESDNKCLERISRYSKNKRYSGYNLHGSRP